MVRDLEPLEQVVRSLIPTSCIWRKFNWRKNLPYLFNRFSSKELTEISGVDDVGSNIEGCE